MTFGDLLTFMDNNWSTDQESPQGDPCRAFLYEVIRGQRKTSKEDMCSYFLEWACQTTNFKRSLKYLKLTQWVWPHGSLQLLYQWCYAWSTTFFSLKVQVVYEIIFLSYPANMKSPNDIFYTIHWNTLPFSMYVTVLLISSYLMNVYK